MVYPKVSVIIPVFNVEKYLSDCVDSLLDQTLDNLELIFVDDASTDNSREILLEYKNAYPQKIVLLYSDKSIGPGGARNLGIKYAKGEYIGFVDSDDYVMPNMFKDLYEEAKRENSDAVFTDSISLDNNIGLVEGREIASKRNSEKTIRKNPLMSCTEEGLVNDVDGLIASEQCIVWNAIWRKNIVFHNDIWFPERLKYEDHYWVKLMLCYLRKISYCSNIKYIHRMSENSIVRSRNSIGHFDRITVNDLLLDAVKKRELLTEYYSGWEYLYISNYCFSTYFCFLDHFDNPNIRICKSLIKKLKHEFPNWRKNKYFVALTSKKYRILCNLIVLFPYTMSNILR